jgi:hypothetical protein
MKQLAIVFIISFALAAAAPQNAHAEPTPAVKGLIVGGISIGSAAVGSLALGAAGVGIGSTTCGGHFECWAPMLYGGIGAVVGSTVGMPLGAALSAKKFGVRPGKVLLNMGLTAGASAGVILIGSLAWSPAISAIGVTGLGLGLPIAAGVTVAHQLNDPETSAALSISPMIRRGRRGVVATVRF